MNLLCHWLPADTRPTDWLGAASVTHAEARQYIVNGFVKWFSRSPTTFEAQFAQAVALGESHYGTWPFTNLITGEQTSNTWNMGAVQCGQKPPCPAGCFEATDSHADGTHYQACFRLYATPQEGFDDLVRQVYVAHDRITVLKAAQSGDIRAFSTALRASGYFELPLEQHIAGITKSLKTITTALHEPMPSSRVASTAGLSGGDYALALAAAIGTVWALNKYRR